MDNNVYQAPESDITTLDNEATQPVKLFNSDGRMGRVRFVCYSMTIPFLIILGALLFGGLLALIHDGLTIIAIIAGVIAYLIAIVGSIFANIQRCHDINISGWFVLLNIIVPFSLVLIFIPGTKGENQYGVKPEPNETIHWVGAWAFPVVIFLFIGLLMTPFMLNF